MFKMFYLLIVLVVWCETQRYAFAQKTQLLTIPDKTNWTSITDELSKKPVIAINGNNNYNVAQQVFYIYNEEQFKKILMNNKNSEKKEGTDETAHKLVTRKITWNSARQSCASEGGYLAIINSDAEEQLLIRSLKENNISSAWVGVHDLYQEGDWVAVNGDSLEETGYSKWTTAFPNQPDNNNGRQNCGLLLVQGGLDDNDCSSAFSYFCEKPAP